MEIKVGWSFLQNVVISNIKHTNNVTVQLDFIVLPNLLQITIQFYIVKDPAGLFLFSQLRYT